MKFLNKDTIAAIATAQGGAIGIVRISGEKSLTIADKIFVPAGKDKRRLSEREPYTLAFGRIADGKGEIVDEVLISIFRAPHSFTGEDSVEISCHGSRYILQTVLHLLIDHGCRQAERGEFTQRAFLNGKMDLSQAEAVADLIASSSRAAHRMAMNQMRGAFSRELSSLRDDLLRMTSLMELELDFSDHEELEFADRTELSALANKIENVISSLVGSFAMGNVIKNGVPVAIIGETNAGKSTLLNALVGDDRAIVSDINGTTRDVIEDTVTIDGTLFRFTDTAGIRDTHDTIERMGIERTFKKLSEASIVLWMIDATCAEKQIKELSQKVLPLCKGKHVIVVLNKSDIANAASLSDIRDKIILSDVSDNAETTSPINTDFISLSAKEGTNIDALRHILVTSAGMQDISENDIIVTNTRHYEALTHALESIRRVCHGLSSSLPSDLISQDLRECLFHLAEITGGEITTDEVLENIFKHFCVGK